MSINQEMIQSVGKLRIIKVNLLCFKYLTCSDLSLKSHTESLIQIYGEDFSASAFKHAERAI